MVDFDNELVLDICKSLSKECNLKEMDKSLNWGKILSWEAKW